MGRRVLTCDEDDVTSKVACGPDPERHLEMTRKYADAGYDEVFVHQLLKWPSATNLAIHTREPVQNDAPE